MHGHSMPASAASRRPIGPGALRKPRQNCLSDRLTEGDGHGVSDLPRNGDLRAHPAVVVREALDPGCLLVRKSPMLGWVQVAALLRFEELSPDRYRRAVPTKS